MPRGSVKNHEKRLDKLSKCAARIKYQKQHEIQQDPDQLAGYVSPVFEK